MSMRTPTCSHRFSLTVSTDACLPVLLGRFCIMYLPDVIGELVCCGCWLLAVVCCLLPILSSPSGSVTKVRFQ